MTANLTWVDAKNTGATYNVYRSLNVTTPAWNKITSGLTALSYTDAPAAGSYVYYVTAVVAGVESAASNTAFAAVPVFAPTSLSITVA
jgi:hypothetical protein